MHKDLHINVFHPRTLQSILFLLITTISHNFSNIPAISISSRQILTNISRGGREIGDFKFSKLLTFLNYKNQIRTKGTNQEKGRDLTLVDMGVEWGLGTLCPV